MNKSNGHGDPNVTSLDEARRRAAAKAKAEQRAAGGRGPSTMPDWVIGGMIVLMAIGYIVSLFAGRGGTGDGTVAPVSREIPEAAK